MGSRGRCSTASAVINAKDGSSSARAAGRRFVSRRGTATEGHAKRIGGNEPADLQPSVPVHVGHGVRTTGLRTNTVQLERTTTLRMCRVDPDSPRSDGLLCRTVGVAVRTGTTHRHRVKIHLRESQRSRDKRSVPVVELAPGVGQLSVGQGIYSNPFSLT